MIEYQILAFVFIVMWWIMPFFVYFDSKKKGEKHPILWAISSYFIPLVFIYYLSIRHKLKELNK